MESTQSKGPGKVLVVTRDPAVARFAEYVLGVWETFEVLCVTGPAVALRLVELERWDLVLTDFELPGSEALNLFSQVRAHSPRLPFAMMTAHPVLPPTAALLEAADGYVTKPMKPSHLIGLATTLIDQCQPARDGKAP